MVLGHFFLDVVHEFLHPASVQTFKSLQKRGVVTNVPFLVRVARHGIHMCRIKITMSSLEWKGQMIEEQGKLFSLVLASDHKHGLYRCFS